MLRGKKVYLRRLDEADLPTTLGWINDPEIMIIMGVRGPRTKHHQDAWYESIACSTENIVFAICLLADSRYVGNTSVFDIDYVHRNAGLSIFIGEEKDRGMGYGLEAVRLLIEYAFDYLNLHKIYCRSNVDKLAALRLYDRLGFKREGVLRQHAYQYGKYVDKTLLGLLRNEYDSRPAEIQE